MVFEELKEYERIQDPDKREAGKIVKSKKKKLFKRKGKSSSMSFSTYKRIKTLLTVGFSALILLILTYFFYFGIKIFIMG